MYRRKQQSGYYGAHRSAEAEQILELGSGIEPDRHRFRWSFQAIHHDLWDTDSARSPCSLIPDGAGEGQP